MKYLTLLALVLSLASLSYSYELAGRSEEMTQRMVNELEGKIDSLGSSITTTATTDTLETFRTNVNSSLSSLQNDRVGTTTAQTFTALQQFTNASSTIFSALSAMIGTTATTTITSAGKVGIASSTPLGSLGVGTAGSTSTVSTGKFCLFGQDSTGRNMYVTLGTTGSQAFSTSTISCF